LPSGTVLHGVSMQSTFLGAVEATAAFAVFGIGFEAWILPLLDPDEELPYDTIFDNVVPKDSADDTLDLDTASLDAGNFWEPGQIDWNSVFDVGLRPQRLFHQSSILTLANSALIVWQDNQTPFLVKYWPGGQMNWRFRRSVRVSQPSVLVFAVANPSMDQKRTTDLVLAEDDIPQVKYMSSVLELALIETLGLAAGGVIAWQAATDLITKHVDPDFFEDGALGTLQTIAFNCQGEVVIDHSVTGTMEVATLTTGR